VEFSYRLTGTGWAEARIADEESWATITASYLSDALGELLEAVGVLLEGADEARCSWQEEPGEFRWIFRRTSSDVRLRVLSFPDQIPPEPDADGTPVFETRQSLAALAAAIADGAQAVLDEYGEDGYRTQWVDSPFPSGHLSMIQRSLAGR
jgi:hypothetical protein